MIDPDLREMLTNPAWGRWIQSLKDVREKMRTAIVKKCEAAPLDEVRLEAGMHRGLTIVLEMAERLHADH